MAKLTLTDTSAGYNLTTTVNANNTAIEAAVENTLSRDGTSPNTMGAELDMNSNQITNLPAPTLATHAARKSYVDAQLAAATASSGDFSEDLAYTFSANTSFTGGILLKNTGGTDWMDVYHDGVDFNTDGTNTTNWNMTGFNISAPAVDADFDAITATSYGGITEANLVDKSASETISGVWTWSAVQVHNANVNMNGNSVINSAGMTLNELADHAETPASGKGQVWVRLSDNNLIYTDEAAEDLMVHFGFFKSGETSETVNNSSTVQADDVMQSITLVSGERYRLLYHFTVNQASATPDIKVDLQSATSGTLSSVNARLLNVSSSGNVYGDSNSTAQVTCACDVGDNMISYEAIFTVGTGATDWRIMWAQATADPTNTTITDRALSIQRMG